MTRVKLIPDVGLVLRPSDRPSRTIEIDAVKALESPPLNANRLSQAGDSAIAVAYDGGTHLVVADLLRHAEVSIYAAARYSETPRFWKIDQFDDKFVATLIDESGARLKADAKCSVGSRVSIGKLFEKIAARNTLEVVVAIEVPEIEGEELDLPRNEIVDAIESRLSRSKEPVPFPVPAGATIQPRSL